MNRKTIHALLQECRKLIKNLVLNCSNSSSQLENPLLRSATLSITNQETCFFSMSAKLLIQKPKQKSNFCTQILQYTQRLTQTHTHTRASDDPPRLHLSKFLIIQVLNQCFFSRNASYDKCRI